MTEEANETLEELELMIGKENAGKVFKLFEGMNIYFPKQIGLNALHKEIYDQLREGVSYHALAIKYGYTKSYIRKIEHKYVSESRARRHTRDNNEVAKYTAPVTNKKKIETRWTQGGLFDEG